jgi:hypothetical protein
MRNVSNEERRSRLGQRHRLAAPASTVEEAARAMVGLHSSDPATVYLSARARVSGLKQDDVEAALYDHRTVVRILGMRRTMFVVPVDLAPLLHFSSTVALMAAERRRLVGMVENAGIANDGEAWVESVTERTLSALRARGEAVATELIDHIPELAEKVTFYKKDGSVLATVGMTTRVLFLLAAEGKIVRGRPKGSWVSSLYRWAPMEEWVGRPLEEMSRPEAQAELLRLWLTAFGPGTELDMKWWTGWPVTQVRAALAAIGALEVEVETWIRSPHRLIGCLFSPVSTRRRWAGRNGSGISALTQRASSTGTAMPARVCGSTAKSSVDGGREQPGRSSGISSRTSTPRPSTRLGGRLRSSGSGWATGW